MDESGRLESGYSGLNRNRGFESLSLHHTKGNSRLWIKCFVALSLLMYGTVQAMTFDNRFLPLLLKPFNRRCDAPSHFSVQPFFMNADRAFHEASRLSIPDIDGCMIRQYWLELWWLQGSLIPSDLICNYAHPFPGRVKGG